jgi:hypothetical protein
MFGSIGHVASTTTPSANGSTSVGAGAVTIGVDVLVVAVTVATVGVGVAAVRYAGALRAPNDPRDDHHEPASGAGCPAPW